MIFPNQNTVNISPIDFSKCRKVSGIFLLSLESSALLWYNPFNKSEFEDGKTVSLTMNAFNKGGIYIRIFGTKGELYANMSDTEFSLYTFDDSKH